MRIVIYDDEDMEPITVVNLRGVGERDIHALGERIRIAVPPPPLYPTSFCDAPATATADIEMRFVDVTFERFTRRGRARFMAFTKTADLAMLLKPDWLPGQRPAVEALWRENDKLTDLFMKVLGVRLAGH